MWQATFYDGMTAKSQTVDICFEADNITFLDAAGGEHKWPVKEISFEQLKHEARITFKPERDATLILSGAAVQALTEQATYLRADKRQRRQFSKLIVGLTVAAAAMGIFVFGIVPSMATFLAFQTPADIEQKIGKNLASQVQLLFRPCQNDEAHALLAPIAQEFADAGDIAFEIEVTLVNTSIPNAFALPGGQVLVTRGFLDAIGEDQEAFWGVIAHELAHVGNRDGMVALYRNLGLSTLLEILTGGSGLAQQAILVGGQLTNLSYTRGQEQAADETAYDILVAKSYNPASLGRALSALTEAIGGGEEREALTTSEGRDWPEWIQTHPDTEKRIARAIARESRVGSELPLSTQEWDMVRSACDMIEPDDE